MKTPGSCSLCCRFGRRFPGDFTLPNPNAVAARKQPRPSRTVRERSMRHPIAGQSACRSIIDPQKTTPRTTSATPDDTARSTAAVQCRKTVCRQDRRRLGSDFARQSATGSPYSRLNKRCSQMREDQTMRKRVAPETTNASAAECPFLDRGHCLVCMGLWRADLVCR